MGERGKVTAGGKGKDGGIFAGCDKSCGDVLSTPVLLAMVVIARWKGSVEGSCGYLALGSVPVFTLLPLQ